MASEARSNLWLASTILVTLGCIALVLTLGKQIFDEQRQLSVAGTDNFEWTTYQVETEMLMLNSIVQQTVSEAARGEATADQLAAELNEVRKRFDLFYSRISIILKGQGFAALRADVPSRWRLDRIKEFLDSEVTHIDSPDAVLLEHLPDMARRLQELRADVRELALSAVSIAAAQETAQREEISRLLGLTGLAGAALVGGLVLLSIFLYRQSGISLRNLSDAEAAARAMARSRAHFQAAVNASLDAIIIASEDGKILEYNAAAESVFGYARDTAIGAPMADLIIPDSLREAHENGMRRHLETGEERVVNRGRVELVACRADGSEFPVEISIGGAVGENGRIFIAFLRDISVRKKTVSDLNDALNRAEAADRAKSEFLAVMSHEMRTPLNGVLGSLDLMRSTALSSQQHRYVDVASEAAEVLLRHVSDVLDATMIERGELRLEATPFSLPKLIGSVADISQAVVGARNNRLLLDTAAVDGMRVVGDPHRLRQVLLNLVTNAAKFTEDGQITLETRVVEETPDGLGVELSVTDTGIGIAPEDQAKVFEDFTTINPSYDRATGGVGLGLAICRRIIHGMGGEIGVTSALGEGSRFHVRLTLAKVTAGQEEIETEARERDISSVGELRVLVADDNDINRIVTIEMLENAGHIADEATDGFEAVRKASAARFDLILMDISMPGMDGFQAAREIRGNEGPSQDAFIFAVTAHAMEEERDRVSEAGMNLCLNKPLRMATLMDALATLRLGDHDLARVSHHLHGQRTEDAPIIDDEVFAELEETLSPQIFARTLQRFSAEIAQSHSIIVEAAASREYETVAATAHSLVGSAGLIGATHLASLMRSLEIAARSGEEAEVRALVEGAEPVARDTRSVLEEILADLTEDLS